MKPLHVPAQAQVWIHVGLVLAQFAVLAFVKDPAAKTQLNSALILLQGSAGLGMQDKSKCASCGSETATGDSEQ